MIDVEKAVAKCEAISSKLSDLIADAETLNAIDEAIDMIHELIMDLREAYDENKRIMRLYEKECENSRCVMRVLKNETEDAWKKKVAGKAESEGRWLQELKLLTEKWELEIEAKKYMCLMKEMNDCSVACE